MLMNEEFLVGAGHQLVPTTSLPFVHTARRYYRLSGLVRPWEGALVPELGQTWSLRGSKSRNKVGDYSSECLSGSNWAAPRHRGACGQKYPLLSLKRAQHERDLFSGPPSKTRWLGLTHCGLWHRCDACSSGRGALRKRRIAEMTWTYSFLERTRAWA